MDHISLGKTGLKVSRLCLGMMTYGSKNSRAWFLNEEESQPILKHAINLGISFWDTANAYSTGVSEEILGRMFKTYGLKREQHVVATKVYHHMGDTPNEQGLSRKHIMDQIDASLKRLRMDYVDLYQIHRFDPSTPIEETIDALDAVVKAGKARYIGASSMFSWQFAQYLYKADLMGKTRFVSMQNHYNLVYREEEREMIPFCRNEGIGIIPWSPMARGFLMGNRGAKKGEGETIRAKTDEYGHGLYYQDDDYKVVDAVTDVAKKRGVGNAQVALAWILQQPGVTAPIIGASKLSHLDDAVKALSLKLSDDELKTLTAPYKPHPIRGHS
ncbi:MAG TPA: aldo/keto reductase [Magnetospirillaceae bacterium]|jgi:aryl-alcohol dehydrogenase (NADP+)